MTTTLPDDSLKDRDCIGFIDAFDPTERSLWLRWLSRLRLADRLAETDPESLRMLASFDYCGAEPRAAEAWSRYLDALADYHRPGLVIRTLTQHDEMLLRLSGPLLQLAPHMPEELWEAAAAFGALDQFWNNVRDLQEDAARGLCWLPEDVLREYGLTREDVIAGRAPDKAGWVPMMQWWIEEYQPQLYRGALDLVAADCLHSSIRSMVNWTLKRYNRVLKSFRAADYDYRRFFAMYWADSQRDLADQSTYWSTRP